MTKSVLIVAEEAQVSDAIAAELANDPGMRVVREATTLAGMNGHAIEMSRDYDMILFQTAPDDAEALKAIRALSKAKSDRTKLVALADGGVVLVNRGFAPLAWKDRPDMRAAPPQGEVEIFGLMRPPEERNAFTPADEPAKGLWYTRDPAAMAAALKLDHPAPFGIDLDADPRASGWPRGGATELNIPNNHLSYAWTWFGLAATLAGVFGVWAWGRGQRA